MPNSPITISIRTHLATWWLSALTNAYYEAQSFLDLPVVTPDALAKQFPPDDCDAFVAISYQRMNGVRRDKYQQLKEAGYRLASFVSSRATYLANPPGDNCFILEDNTVQPFVSVGSNVTLWSGNHIGHDSVIEDHCFISHMW